MGEYSVKRPLSRGLDEIWRNPCCDPLYTNGAFTSPSLIPGARSL